MIATQQDARALYLDLMKRCLTRLVFESTYRLPQTTRGTARGTAIDVVRRLLPRDYEIVRRESRETRAKGEDWPADAETMIGMHGLDNIEACVVDVLERGVGGDLIEAGVWRGGATIFMRAILKAYGVTDRRVWVADSFRGLPTPNERDYPADAGFDWSRFGQLAVSVDDVKANFARYGLLDDQVRFLVGWFKDTLPAAPIEQIAVMRLDGDMYESTMDALRGLYPKLAVGGYVIVDDYGRVEACRRAVDEYRAEHGVTEPIAEVPGAERRWWNGVFWRRER